MTARETITVDDLDAAIERYRSDGYRLDMIMPADDPHEALVSRDGEMVRLVAGSKFNVQSSKSPSESDLEPGTLNLEPTAGRAGMMYRDLIADRLGGKLIASHIRIVEGGEVADSVHYHKIDFQLIYCLKGAIKVVYEDQGDAFWLKPGDCVLQPPEIRHRVLHAEAGSEVIELTSPAEHETWFDHEIQLPNQSVQTDRLFGSQRFVRHIADVSTGDSANQTEMSAATDGKLDVFTLQSVNDEEKASVLEDSSSIRIEILINGRGIRAVFKKKSDS